MADTYIINASNQTVTGTAAGEIFEFDSTLTNGTFTNVVINAAGGKDTIKAGTQSATRQTIDAVVTGLNPSSRLDFGDTYGDNFFYFSTQPDGIHITNENGAYKFKLLGVTDTSICTGDTKNMFMALQQTTKWDDYLMGGTALADTLTVNHARCKATGRGGDDFMISSGNFNLLEGSDGNDIVINMGNNGTLRGDNGDDILICGGSNNVLQGGDGNDAFELYSYTAGGSNTTLTGGNGNNAYLMSTGLVGVNGALVNEARFNGQTSDTLNVVITDAKAGDSYYMRDGGEFGITAATTQGGIVISSTSGRINVTLAGQNDWNAVKDNTIMLANMNVDGSGGTLYTYTLEQALVNTASATVPTVPPEGVSVQGQTLTVSANFVGNLIMSSPIATYKNDQIVTINASLNAQAGMQLGGNRNGNVIYAGTGGNALWGGQDTASDSLFGGAGADIFLVGKGDDNDNIYNADANDTVELYDVTISDIVDYACNANTIELELKSGNVVSLFNGDEISPTFKLADGQSYRYNRTSNSWQGA